MVQHVGDATGVMVAVTHKSGSSALHHLDLFGVRRLPDFRFLSFGWRMGVPYAGSKFDLRTDQALVRTLTDVLIWYADVTPEDT